MPTLSVNFATVFQQILMLFIYYIYLLIIKSYKVYKVNYHYRLSESVHIKLTKRASDHFKYSLPNTSSF